jgi:membrane-associated protein
VVGGITWVGLFLFGGYFFGNLPFVKDNFTIVILAIIGISVVPGIVEYLRERSRSKAEAGADLG